MIDYFKSEGSRGEIYCSDVDELFELSVDVISEEAHAGDDVFGVDVDDFFSSDTSCSGDPFRGHHCKRFS